MPCPDKADAWRFYPARPCGGDGLRTNVSDVWGGMAICSDEADARAVFSGATVDGYDGLTVSIWRDEFAMRPAAYKDGKHRAGIDRQPQIGMVDRGSLARTRELASKGTWDGTDPIAEIAQ